MKKRIFLLLMLVLVSFGLSACNDAKTQIMLPAVSQLSAVEVTNEAGTETKIVTDTNWMTQLFEELSKVEATDQTSVQDVPVADVYWQIDFVFSEEGKTTAYLYEEEGKWYLEQPYVAIYQAPSSCAEFLQQLWLT